jgi:hypothetical protein
MKTKQYIKKQLAKYIDKDTNIKLVRIKLLLTMHQNIYINLIP